MEVENSQKIQPPGCRRGRPRCAARSRRSQARASLPAARSRSTKPFGESDAAVRDHRRAVPRQRRQSAVEYEPGRSMAGCRKWATSTTPAIIQVHHIITPRSALQLRLSSAVAGHASVFPFSMNLLASESSNGIFASLYWTNCRIRE